MPPIIVVGYSAPWAGAFGFILPVNAMVFVEEPDVVRKRDILTTVKDQPVVREVVGWDFQLDGAADRFYNAHRDLAPVAVLPMVEYAVPFAARLAERYGLPGAGYGAARLLRDKHLLREVTAAAGIANPESVPVDSPDEVREFMARIGGPVVLKPANRQGALGTRIIADPAEIDAAWAECTVQDEGVYVPDRPIPVRMLVERCLHGDEFSVEMLVVSGRPVFGGVTRKFLFGGPRPVEQGHLHPADLPDELSSRMIADTARVLDAVGVDTTFAHCEWIVEDGVPHLVECAGRMAGDNIIELVILAWEYFVVGDYLAALRGEPLTTQPPDKAPKFAVAWFAHVPVGEVDTVEGVEEARAVPGVNTVVAPQAGARTTELRSNWDRPILVTASGASADEALDRARSAVAHIKVTVRDS
ncbi:MAG: biotin carboxylase [Actinobacteria bacterium 13_2_20CM_2_71_6]|nr:MAG: biotin carboxylase [Actinobacteria bacterium 13_2_20CM_2_71_6]